MLLGPQENCINEKGNENLNLEWRDLDRKSVIIFIGKFHINPMDFEHTASPSTLHLWERKCFLSRINLWFDCIKFSTIYLLRFEVVGYLGSYSLTQCISIPAFYNLLAVSSSSWALCIFFMSRAFIIMNTMFNFSIKVLLPIKKVFRCIFR